MIDLTEAKNVHMEHIEDLIFNEGIDGARKAINFMRDLRNMLAGHVKTSQAITVKWDGAPAIFVGVDPSDGKFFVAKKGIFNKNPILYKSVSDVKNDPKLNSELKKKFVVAYQEFSKLGIRSGVYQGDLMFTKSDIKVETIEGEKYFTFQPNTIVYAVPVKSHLGKIIARARIGVVWHTTYTGKDLSSMSASFGKGIVSRFKSIPTVWQDDATFKDVSGKATFTSKETAELTAYISEAGKILNRISNKFVSQIHDNEELLIRLKTFNNSIVRSGEAFPHPSQHVSRLYNYISNWYDEQIASKKTERGKEPWREKKKIGMKIFSNPGELEAIYRFMNIMIDAKQMIVNKLNEVGSLSTFLRTRNGFNVTNQEGFVAIDHIHGAVKLVDRMEFSRANFSPEIIKGWQR